MTSPFLQVWNKHTASCGAPPMVSNEDSDKYVSYFENRYGEQWVFVYDRQTKKGELRGGDVKWDTVLPVHEGQDQMTLNDDEATWLRTCWKAATFS